MFGVITWLWLVGSTSYHAAQPTPIEVEVVQFRASGCAPGPGGFDKEFRTQIDAPRLLVTDSTRIVRSMPNPFCLASRRPDMKPVHVGVEIGSDGSATPDFVLRGSAPGHSSEHWIVHVATPLRGVRSLPVVWRRSSFWARSDRASYCDTVGRVIALYALEGLGRAMGRIKNGEQLVLGEEF